VIALIAAHDADIRDRFLDFGGNGTLEPRPFLSALAAQCKPDKFAASPELVYTCLWALAILCGHTQSRDRPPQFEIVKICMPLFSGMLAPCVNDEVVVFSALTALSALLPQYDHATLAPLFHSIVKLLDDAPAAGETQTLIKRSARVHHAAMTCVSEAATTNAATVKVLMGFKDGNKSRLLSVLPKLLSSGDVELRLAAAQFVVQCLPQGFAAEIVESDIVKSMTHLLSTDEAVRGLAARFFRELCKLLMQQQLVGLVHRGMVKMLSMNLAHFRSSDQHMGQIFQYYGHGYHQEFAKDLLEAIEAIVRASEEHVDIVPAFDEEFVNHLQTLMSLVSQANREASKLAQANSDMDALVSKVTALANLIKSAHLRRIADPHTEPAKKQWFKHMDLEFGKVIAKFQADNAAVSRAQHVAAPHQPLGLVAAPARTRAHASAAAADADCASIREIHIKMIGGDHAMFVYPPAIVAMGDLPPPANAVSHVSILRKALLFFRFPVSLEYATMSEGRVTMHRVDSEFAWKNALARLSNGGTVGIAEFSATQGKGAFIDESNASMAGVSRFAQQDIVSLSSSVICTHVLVIVFYCPSQRRRICSTTSWPCFPCRSSNCIACTDSSPRISSTARPRSITRRSIASSPHSAWRPTASGFARSSTCVRTRTRRRRASMSATL
jgi:hypothetical protein